MNKGSLLLCIWLSDTGWRNSHLCSFSTKPGQMPQSWLLHHIYSHPCTRKPFPFSAETHFWSEIVWWMIVVVSDKLYSTQMGSGLGPQGPHSIPRQRHTHTLMAASGKTIWNSETVIVSPRALCVQEKSNICLKCFFVCVQGHFH